MQLIPHNVSKAQAYSGQRAADSCTSFSLISLLEEIIASPRSGRLHIVGKDVAWCLDIVDGKLLFATHSLQYLSALETVLPAVGCEAAVPAYLRLTQMQPYSHTDKLSVEALEWTSQIVGSLVLHSAIALDQAEKVLVKLAEDAAEALLGLDTATITWQSVPKSLWHLTTPGLSLASLKDYLITRLRAWQPLSDCISSPLQRPYCENLQDLSKPVSRGLLSPQMLESVARLMQGASIRQLAHTVKQDEVKLAQLLYPYIQQRVIKLWPPIQPLDRLPELPRELPTEVDAPQVASVVSSPTAAASSQGASRPSKISGALTKPKYLIVCIDDSQVMLETIESYLDAERFELKPIIEPVSSVAEICAIKPDVVLMDVSMPSIDGNSLCKILRRSYMFKDIPIIMISGNTSPLNKAKAESAGATDYLEKPFSKEQLLKLLNIYLEDV